MEEWQVRRSTGVCCGTGKALEPGEEYYAALVDMQTCFERRDYSCEYWQKDRPEVFSYWKTRVPHSEQKKKLFVDDSVLLNFFERLEGQEEPLKVNFRFVLALILMRKRVLKYEDSQRVEGVEIWKMRLAGSRQMHEVVNPQLNDEQTEQVSQELSSILQGEL